MVAQPVKQHLLAALDLYMVIGNYEENLSVATYMNYTRLFQQLYELWQLRLYPLK